MNTLRFQITKLSATVPDGVPIQWQGKEFRSGSLTIELDESADPSCGALDYTKRKAMAEFHIRLRFTEIADLLESLGLNPAMGRPIQALLRSEGDILEDHSFVLSGGCRVAPHPLFDAGDAAASVLPGH